MSDSAELIEDVYRILVRVFHFLLDHGHHPTPPPEPPTPPTPAPPPPPPPPPPVPPPTGGVIAWSNTDGSLAGADIARWIAALNAQVSDLQALWPHVQEWTHVFVPSGQAAPPGALAATIKPDLPEAPGALAYHSVDDNGAPFIVVGSQTCLQAGVTISSAMSHEAVELTVDPGCQLTATDPSGNVVALEVGDPVEGTSYLAPDGVTWLSDFVGPAWFGQGTGPLDQCGDAIAAWEIAADGYAVVNNQPVFGPGLADVRKRNVEALGQLGTPRRPKAA